MLLKIYVTHKKGVLDPQGKTVLDTLHSLGYKEFEELRLGKYFEIKISDDLTDKELLNKKIKEIADKVLSNPIMETYRYEIVD